MPVVISLLCVNLKPSGNQGKPAFGAVAWFLQDRSLCVAELDLSEKNCSLLDYLVGKGGQSIQKREEQLLSSTDRDRGSEDVITAVPHGVRRL